MFFILLFACLTLAWSQEADDDWLDPHDMLNYDATSKTMRKPVEARHFNGATSGDASAHDPGQTEMTSLCYKQVADLRTQIQVGEKRVESLLQQPTCIPVFKRFIRRLVRDITRLGLPADSTELHYDAHIKVSRQGVSEMEMFLEGEESWQTGALDSALSQLLVDLRAHDYPAWRWRFEDTFGVELDTLLKLLLAVLVLVVAVSTELWSCVSWCVQFKRLFVVCFLVSIVWNWLYLYKTAFAEHQKNMVMMDSSNDKCTGVKAIDWSDNLKEWFRSTWTLQDDPCKKYYEVLMVDPILLVPPTKAISVTMTTFITEPLKHIGHGISEFLRALLQDLPITLQIPVLLTIVLSILVFMYGSVQAAFRYGITAPLRHRTDPPLPEPDQPGRRSIEDGGRAEEVNARPRSPQIRGNEASSPTNGSHRARAVVSRMFVETLRTASTHGEYELDSRQGVEMGQGDHSPSGTDSDTQAQSRPETREGHGVASQHDTKTKELVGSIDQQKHTLEDGVASQHDTKTKELVGSIDQQKHTLEDGVASQHDIKTKELVGSIDKHKHTLEDGVASQHDIKTKELVGSIDKHKHTLEDGVASQHDTKTKELVGSIDKHKHTLEDGVASQHDIKTKELVGSIDQQKHTLEDGVASQHDTKTKELVGSIDKHKHTLEDGVASQHDTKTKELVGSIDQQKHTLEDGVASQHDIKTKELVGSIDKHKHTLEDGVASQHDIKTKELVGSIDQQKHTLEDGVASQHDTKTKELVGSIDKHKHTLEDGVASQHDTKTKELVGSIDRHKHTPEDGVASQHDIKTKELVGSTDQHKHTPEDGGKEQTTSSGDSICLKDVETLGTPEQQTS
ncbi:chloride channel CLIC-like protein 1 isoform X2 [Nerophis ophidion]|uniref:chloride channel CLIC-like protein 1 isoform X2 n=1 Tax=Nerophis ophidion TaxID=159077 RepID=UPI002ADF5AFE|nr:chloride channel CLIC-like protein 1 isoform X2 [Nerophis ophidion]